MRGLFAGVFLISLAIGASSLVLPLYASSLGADYAQIGLLGVSYILLGVFFSIPVGRVGDRRGRRGLMAAGFVATALVLTLYSLAYAVMLLILVRLFQGLTETFIWVNTQSTVADGSSTASRGRMMGQYGRSWGIGTAAGPVMGGLLYGIIGAQHTFLVTGVVGFASAAIVMSMPQLRIRGAEQDPIDPGASGAQAASRTPGLGSLCLAGFVYIGIVAIVFTLLPVYATISLGMTAFGAGLMITIFSLARALAFTPLGSISDRLGHRPTILAGVIGSSVVLAALAVVSNALLLAVAIAVLGVTVGAIYPAVMSGISKMGYAGNTGYMLGIFNAVSNVGWGLFPGIGGVFADAYGPIYPFLMSAVIGLVSFAILLRALPRDREPKGTQAWQAAQPPGEPEPELQRRDCSTSVPSASRAA